MFRSTFAMVLLTCAVSSALADEWTDLISPRGLEGWLGDVESWEVRDGVLIGQPNEDALVELSKRGCKTVVSLRGVGEERYDEASICEKLGMQFVRFPIGNPGDINEELVSGVCEILSSAKPGAGVLLHCASADRVGAVWLAHRVKEGRMAVPQARAEAAKVGLKTKELEEKSLEYLGH